MIQATTALTAAVAATTVPATPATSAAVPAGGAGFGVAAGGVGASSGWYGAADRAFATPVGRGRRAAAEPPETDQGRPGAAADQERPGGMGQVRAGVVWRGCGDGLECGKLAVPVDWRRPGGARTEVDVARMPARDPGRSQGALVVNIGEGSTMQRVRARPDGVSELARWFDVVFVESRGIGDRGSAAMVRCSVPPPDPRRVQLTPGLAAWRAYAEDNAAYDRSCRIAAGPAYAGLTSWQVAHDLDALRAALGETRLRYVGNGYGAVYGQAYLELFPRRAGRMYLEGVPDHGEPSLGRRLIAHARTAERQLASFRDWCANQLGCPLDDDDAVAVLDGLLERAPLAAGPGRSLDARQITVAVLAGLVPERWQELAGAMSAAEEGDASALATMAAVAPPVGPGTVARSMACHDFMPAVPDYRRFLAMESRLREVAPRVGWLTGRYEVARCLGLRGRPSWPPGPAQAGQSPSDGPARARQGLPDGPARVGQSPSGGPARVGQDLSGGPARVGQGPSGRLAGGGGGPSALVGIGRLDTVSPGVAAARMARRIPGAAVLWHGDGHDAYLLQGVGKLRATCLRTRVHDYLVNGTRPPSHTLCPGGLTAGAGS
ncbi:alpha/beta hydrolase [Nonomuraea insulae]|uniref:Alpha/beta hydrolase n=1 Tax=Nonomuraea insulae TaxID=1616787 RepID=A0ABW1D454_9ACTN